MTANDRQPPRGFSFALVADSHVADRPFQGRQKFARLVRQLNDTAAGMARDGHPLAFVQLLGDLKLPRDTTPAELLDDLEPPLRLIFGNNDHEPARTELARYTPGLPAIGYTAYTEQGCLFACIDSAVAGQHLGTLPDTQKQWLTGVLENSDTPGSRTFLFGHVPPGPPREPVGPMLMDIDARQFLEDIFRRFKPAAAFFGHLHHPEQFELGGVPVHVLPSSCWNFDPRRSLCSPRELIALEQPTEAAPPAFMVVTVEPTGYSTTVVPLDMGTASHWTNRLALDQPGASPDFI
ncbi:MAG: metallophosphoesterase family protein [Planctomycetota bacterium]